MTARASLVVGALLTGLSATTAAAQSSGEDWSFTLAPYIWGPGLDGSISSDFPQAGTDIDVTFDNVSGELNGAFAGFFEARRGPLGFAAEALFIDVGAEVPTPRGIVADAVTDDVQAGIYSGYVGYAFVDTPKGHVDAVAGLRYWDLENAVALSGGPFDGTEVLASASWTDPLLGVRGVYDLSDRVFVSGWALAGGWGVGSENTYDAMGSLGFRFNERAALTLGYRAVRVEFESDELALDVTQRGWISSLVFTF